MSAILACPIAQSMRLDGRNDPIQQSPHQLGNPFDDVQRNAFGSDFVSQRSCDVAVWVGLRIAQL